VGAFSVALTGGIEPANVLINYAGIAPVVLGPGFSIQGIVLAPRAAVTVSGGSLTPELIAQSVLLAGGAETGYVSDDFNRPDGPVGSAWQDFAEEPMVISSGGVADPSGNSYGAGYWKASDFTADQYSEARIAADGGADVLAVLARASGSGVTDRRYYQVYWDSAGTLQLGFYANNATYPGGFYRDIGTPVTRAKAPGDVLRLEVDGAALRVLVNGVLETSAADSELVSGSPGLLVYGAAKFDSWRGGNLP
jgi:hypothetical protein